MEEEAQHPHPHSENTSLDYRSKVDTSRPFSSVKEAVAIFGERLLVGEIYSPKPYVNVFKQETSWKFSPPSPMKPREDNEDAVFDTLKKLEAELEETKVEVKLLMERESETEVALASLNAELHKNMSKLAEAEAALAARESREGGVREAEERRKRELMMIRMEDSPNLAQILSSGGRKYEGKMTKKKPIIPLVGDLFSRKKRSSTTLDNLLNSSPHHLYN